MERNEATANRWLETQAARDAGLKAWAELNARQRAIHEARHQHDKPAPLWAVALAIVSVVVGVGALVGKLLAGGAAEMIRAALGA